MLTCRDGLQYQGFSYSIAADELNNDINMGVGNHQTRVIYYRDAWSYDALGPGYVQICHHGDFNPAPGATLNFSLIAPQYIEGTTAYDAYAKQAHLNWFHG
jgi:hypothetical protein